MIIHNTSKIKYIITKRWKENKYLDEYDNIVNQVYKARLFDSYSEARDYRDNMEAEYLYKIAEVQINYIISDYE